MVTQKRLRGRVSMQEHTWSEMEEKGIVIKVLPIHLGIESHVRYVGYIGHGKS